MAEVKNIPVSADLVREKSSLTTDISTEVAKEPKGLAKPPKKSFGTKLKETFIAEDAKDVGEYIVWDILIPTIKRTIRDIIVGSADRIFLGSSTPPSSRLYQDRGVTLVRPQTSYSSISAKRQTSTKSVPAQVSPQRNNFDILDMTFDDRGRLEQAFDDMLNVLEEYGKLSINEYAEILSRYFNGIPNLEYTAQLWGWRSLASASIVNTLDGYYLKTPKPMIIREG